MSCGGGGGSNAGGTGGNTSSTPSPSPQPTFGLTSRPNLAAFNLPAQSGSSGTYTLTSAYPNLSFSAAILAAPVPGENRLVVIEQGGRVLAFEDDASTTSSRLIMDISSQIIFAGEQGLLGFAFDPDFVNNRYIYVHYTTPSTTPAQTSVIARFTWDSVSDQVSLSSERVLLTNPQTFTNHNGGMLAFGPDDYLYIAFGDSGSGGDPNNEAQDLTTLHGNVLRIDVHPADPNLAYVVPPDNPYVGDPSALPEIWANGLRNPFRFSFDSQTGELWLGDVGQNEREEVNVIERGGNYGWRVFEGNLPFNSTGNTLPDSAFTPPVFDYPHSEGRSVIGGYVYRGSRFSDLFGKYVFSDFVSGSVWALTWNGTEVTQREAIASTSNPTGFAEKRDGELLVVTIGGDVLMLNDDGSATQIPALLSETGLFIDLSNLTPASGLIEYDVQIPFWSDGASKRRWVGVPDTETVAFSEDRWAFPAGAVTLKHFEINTPDGTRRLETRVMVNTDTGWQGFTYRWNAAQTDADLLLERETELITVSTPTGPREQTYEYPSRTDCFVCHTDTVNTVLGLRTPQLNGDFNYINTTDNQLRSWNNVTLFDTDIGDANQYDRFAAIDDSTETLSLRARAYLDVNCSSCHQQGGTSTAEIDLRYNIAESEMNVIDRPPTRGDLGITNARLIAPGNKEQSILWQRMNRRDGDQMPPLGSHVVDASGVNLVGEWIDSL